MDTMAGFILGVFVTISLGFISAGLWYIETTSAWDHRPTDEELGQRLLEDFILPRGDL